MSLSESADACHVILPTYRVSNLNYFRIQSKNPSDGLEMFKQAQHSEGLGHSDLNEKA
jgi:hypothetical protein